MIKTLKEINKINAILKNTNYTVYWDRKEKTFNIMYGYYNLIHTEKRLDNIIKFLIDIL